MVSTTDTSWVSRTSSKKFSTVTHQHELRKVALRAILCSLGSMLRPAQRRGNWTCEQVFHWPVASKHETSTQSSDAGRLFTSCIHKQAEIGVSCDEFAGIWLKSHFQKSHHYIVYNLEISYLPSLLHPFATGLKHHYNFNCSLKTCSLKLFVL